jgi:hypothetical protein
MLLARARRQSSASRLINSSNISFLLLKYWYNVPAQTGVPIFIRLLTIALLNTALYSHDQVMARGNRGMNPDDQATTWVALTNCLSRLGLGDLEHFLSCFSSDA